MPTTYLDVSRQTSNVIADPEISNEIWAKAVEDSFFMKHARRITIPGVGVKIQTITGEPTANWVEETNAKPISTHTFGKKTIIPYKLAVIEPFSDEFVRDKRALYDELVRRLPKALATKFDATIMGSSAPGSGFDVLGGCTKVSLNPAQGSTVYDQFLTVDSAISTANGTMDTIGLAPAGKTKVQGAIDQTGHPLFTPGVGSAVVNGILGAQVDVNKNLFVAGTAAAGNDSGTPAIVGIAGDFSDAMYGMVEVISIETSREATLSDGNGGTINLWQQNMTAVKAEVSITFAVKSTSEFVLLTGDVPSA